MKYHIAIVTIVTLVLASCGRNGPEEQGKVTESEQIVSNLTPEDQARLGKQRAFIEGYLGNEDSKQKYQKAAGKLGLLGALLQQKVFKSAQTYELQCMGVVLGDAFVQELGMQWVMVQDEYGRDPAVKLEGTSIILYPLTMISKRVERGEEVDIFGLFNGIAARVDELKANGF